ELRRDDGLVAAFAEGAAEELLGTAGAVDIGRVEKVDADVERLVHDGLGLFVGDPPAEVVAADPDGGDLQARVAQVAVVHGVPHSRRVLAPGGSIGRAGATAVPGGFSRGNA